jgi:hypothetical protein
VDIRQHTTSGDGHPSEQFVEFLVVAYSKLQVARNDTLSFVVTSSVASKLKDLSAKVFKYGGHVHWGTGTKTGSQALVSDVPANSCDRELEASSCASGRGFACSTSSAFASFTSHGSTAVLAQTARGSTTQVSFQSVRAFHHFC